MGCCVSSNKTSTSSVPTIQPPKPTQNNGTSFQVEEEKVKEVLLETPKLNPKTTIKSKPPKQHLNIKAFDKFKEEQSKVNHKKTLSINKGDTSETCRLRKTMPKPTTEKTGKRVTGSPIKLLKNCSFPGDVSDGRDRTFHSSRNFGSVKMVQCRDQLGRKMVNEGMRRRRDSGENSFRRSRSPATCTDTSVARPVVGRSQSARKTSRAPVARDRTTLPEKGRRKTEMPAMDGKRSRANESLENPLVSLECFIFL
ncbi:hypothetical protein MtrunA17_Chr4g0047911 [Medicago truncatula]|uniref:Uncharacterized protein n=1 Tax=Medicago truncatula TaxID=3880 RepID=A0A072UPX9_MEDTR|nr:uncharacterized protein LOC25493221 [Medicago truncatula]KEH31133.1 hypothetical protein MTR_4g089190 [Medicago truncatula]RHN62484.1 hypothetical protein MtrunA17_Chr4g0047911 [Medicago truncatula]